MMRFLITAALSAMLAAMPAVARADAKSPLTAFSNGTGHLETGYAGLGNDNEPLSTAMYTAQQAPGYSPASFTLSVPSTIHRYKEQGFYNKTEGEYYKYVEVNEVDVPKEYTCEYSNPSLTVRYTLCGDGLRYVTAVRVWARPLAGRASWGIPQADGRDIDDAFIIPFDQRDPAGQGCVLLGEVRSNDNAGAITGTARLKPGTQYLLYLTVNLQSDYSDLPLLRDRLTRIGGQITQAGITDGGTSLPYTGTYSYTTYYEADGTAPDTDKKYRGDEKLSITHESLTITGSHTASGGVEPQSMTYDNGAVADMASLGSRVLVPGRKVLFSPGDNYSRFYRIPSMVSTSTGHLVAISDARKYYAHDIANDIDMVCRVSTDHGVSWGPISTIAKGEARDADGQPLPLGPDGEPLNVNVDYICKKSVGFGDAATAALGDGRVLVTMVEGGSIHSRDTSDPKTYASYCILNDKGEVLVPRTHIPEALYTAAGASHSSRGCIAPGNMCVLKHGPLKGKVMACMRVHEINDETTDQGYGNFFLIFDPATNQWSNFISQRSGNVRIYRTGGGNDDESQLVELDTYQNDPDLDASFGHNDTYTACSCPYAASTAPRAAS